MKRTFVSEDLRKTKLFAAWMQYQELIDQQFNLESENTHFLEIIEDLFVISGISKNRMDLRASAGRSIRHVRISEEMSEILCRMDLIYLVLGRLDNQWLPLEIISLGSEVAHHGGEYHISVHPAFIGSSPEEQTEH